MVLRRGKSKNPDPKHNEERLRAILDSAFDAIVGMDADGLITDWNPQAERIFGWSKDEAIGKRMSALIIPPEFREAHERGLRHFFATGVGPILNRTIEVDALRRSGELFPIRMAVNAIPLNQTYLFTAFVADITAQKEAERTQREESERLAAIVQTQLEVAQTGLDRERLMGVIVDRARANTQAMGAVIELVEGDEMVYHAASDPALREAKIRLKLTGSLSGLCVTTGEVLVCEDARTDPRVDRAACERIGVLSMVVVPLQTELGPIGVLKVYSEVVAAFHNKHVETLKLMAGLLSAALRQATEFEAKQQAIRSLEATEVDLIRSRELADQATRAKSDFLANVSHEIRTPINGVVGMTGLLLDTELSAQQRDFAETIRSCADTLLVLVNDILDFSKIEADKLDLEMIDFDLEQLVTDVERTLSFAAKRKSLELRHALAGDLPASVYRGDPTRIGQVLSNLVNNAIKFTVEGSVTISITRDPRVDHLRFEIVDTGIGIPENTLSKMFQAFSQADSSTTRKFGGTGLGLSISKRLVQLMGGEIGVKSQEKVGTTFWFTLPLKTSVEEARSKRTRAPEGDETVPTTNRATRVLIAEDNSINQRIARAMLEKYGYRVDAVANGLEALEALRAAPYDLILMDCQMPELDGYAATRKIREFSMAEVARIPIIAMTANAMEGDREKCLEAGMDEYVTKPIKARELVAAIEKLLKERKQAA